MVKPELGLTRRRVLAAAAAGAVAATVPHPAEADDGSGGSPLSESPSEPTPTPASKATASPAPTPVVTSLGPAVFGAPIVGATVAGNSAFLIMRGLEPATLAEYDLSTGRVVVNHDLPTGLGGAVAVGGAVYAGMYAIADIHRLDRATGQVDHLTRLGNEQYAFDLAASPAGLIYAGTYPGGKVYEIDPTTGGTRDLGEAVPGLRYVRCVAVAGDGTVYAGTGTSARLVTIDPATGAGAQILPAALHGESFVYDVAVSDEHIVAGTEPGGFLAVIDRRDPSRFQVVATGGRTIDAITIDGETAYFTVRPTGTLYACRLDTGELTRLATPVEGQETRGVFVRDGVVHGAAGAGVWWTLADGAVTSVDLADVGLRTAPEPPQSLSSVDGGRVLVGGNFGLQVHDLLRGGSHRIAVDGEPKSMVPARGRTCLAVYPGALVETYDQREDRVAPLATIGGESNRPRAMVTDPAGRVLLVGTRNQYGRSGGALAVVDPRTGRVDRYDDLVADQAVAAVAVDGRTVYAGTEITVDGALPIASEACLVGFDLTRRQVEWTSAPVSGATGYVSLVHHDGLLYAVTVQGVLVVVDPSTRDVVGSARIPTGRPGYLGVRSGVVYAITTDALLRVDPDAAVTPVVSGLAAEWYNEPQFAVDGQTGDVFTVRERDLVRIHIPD
ncbi:PQQ-binding-like beta-propeller repeat protein [Actinopolymorpha pittospori]|uniref:Outer membrane protein assembly factor BamB n=1 Tax=Actinopolymorpha pittospori TaxID=648752 RepID=A0A927MXI3_9ACTN|nr:PQQ-binding-like beta-propeller repeat protein [Actinopolymorpha pittospori]MBE1607103.1 outer membrane protein assembly factor BamB [Actinopolymorpha pittospori]